MQNTEIIKWRALAMDANPNARKLALELAPSIASEIQDELILWFLANENYEVKKNIYELLDANSLKTLNEIYGEKSPKSLDKIEEIKLLRYTDDEALRKTIMKDAIRKRLPSQNIVQLVSIIQQIKDYRDFKQCSLVEAKTVIEIILPALQKKAKL